MTRGVSKGLSKEIILTAAFEIVETGGVEALSMRRLGTALGVAAMAIYNHFPDREHLLDAMAECAMSAIAIEDHKSNWKKQIKSIARSVAKLSIDRPAVFALCMSRPQKPRAAIALMSRVLEAMRSGGLSEREALICYHSVLILLHGFPFWHSGLIANCSVTPNATSHPGLTAQEIKDWQLIHKVDAGKQLEASLDLLLEGIFASSSKKK